MRARGLSPTQHTVVQRLRALAPGWYTAYDLRCSLATLRALRRLGVVEQRGDGDLGALWSPRTALHFRLCAAGVAAA